MAFIPATCNISEEWVTGGWVSLSFLAMLVVMLFLSLTYMMSVFLKRIRWTIWAKEEFYQVIITCVIILFIAFFAETACSVSLSLAGADPFRVADTYLNDLIWQKSVSLASNLYFGSLFYQITAVYFVPSYGQTIKSGIYIFSGMNALAGVLDLMFGIVSTLFASMFMQVMILWLIQAFAFKVMLPLGIFFRIFPFLRTAGATFIALALAFYIVYPLTYVMSKDIMEGITGKKIDFKNSPDQSFYFANDSNFNILASVWVPDLVQRVADLIPPAVFLPMFSILITIACARSLTKILSQPFPSPFEEPQAGKPSVPTMESMGP